MIYFNQYDAKWRNIPYSAKPPHNETISSAGCGLCSACMIIDNLTDNYIEPPEMAKYSVNNGYRIDGVGTSFGLFTAIAKKYNIKMYQTSDIYRAIGCVRNGGMAVCSTNGGKHGLFSTGGHLFVLADVEGNDCVFFDSGLYNGKYNKLYRRSKAKVRNNKVYVNVNQATPEITTFFCYERKDKMNKYSFDNTVEHLIRLGITDKANMEHWELCLNGKKMLNPEEVRALFDRLIAKVYDK